MSLHLDNIKIKDGSGDKELKVPIKDIHTLIVDNYRTVLSTHLMNALSKANVNVVLCGVDHMPQSLITPVHGNRQAPFMLRKQLAWHQYVKRALHQEMVRAKIDNQLRLLKHAGCQEEAIMKLEEYRHTTLPGDRNNREGLAAKVYFRALFGPDFKRFKKDIVNAGLNFGYSILRSQISKTVLAKGLNPCLGIFHHGPNNPFNLSDDFLEPFRPYIDVFVQRRLNNGEEKLLKREHKLALIRHTTGKVKFRGVQQTLFNAIAQYVDAVVAFADSGDYDKLSHPVIDFNGV